MNALNRVIVILLLVIFLVLLPVLIFLGVVMPDASLATAEQAITSVQNQTTILNRAVFAVVAGLLFVAGVLLLWMEVRRPQAKAIGVQDITVGEARVSIESVVQRLEYNIDRLQDVVTVRPVVKPKGNGVDVIVNLQTTPEIDVPMKTQEVVQVTRQVVEEQMGLKLQNVQVEIKHAPYPEGDVL